MAISFDRSWFERAKKTQRQVAREVGIDEAYLSKVVRGQIEPSVVKAIQIANALGCTVEELYSKEGVAGLARRTRRKRP